MIHPKKSEEIINKCRTTLFGIVCLVIFLSSATGFGADTSKKVKVFILAGQSNMEGKAKVELLEYQINQPEMRDFSNILRKTGDGWSATMFGSTMESTWPTLSAMCKRI